MYILHKFISTHSVTHTLAQLGLDTNIPDIFFKDISRHSKSNPIELNFNRAKSNSIHELNPWIEFD